MQSYFEAYTKSKEVTSEDDLNSRMQRSREWVQNFFGYVNETRADLQLDKYNYFITDLMADIGLSPFLLFGIGWVIWYFFKNYLGYLLYIFTDGPWTWKEFAVTYFFWIADDWSSGIGFQADDKTPCLEGNPGVCRLLTNMIEKYNMASTETSALRIVHTIWVMNALLLNLIPGLNNPWSKLMWLMTMIFKSWAGFRWFWLFPNEYGIVDWITFKPGKRRFDRMTFTARIEYMKTHFNLTPATVYTQEERAARMQTTLADMLGKYTRRRMIETTVDTASPVAPKITGFVDILKYFFG